jgi:hypothetical protein
MHDREFKLKPSRQYLALIFIAFAISVITACLLPVNGWLILAAAFVAACYVGDILWSSGLLLSQNAVLSVRRQLDGEWYLRTHQAEYRASLLGDSIATGFVLILRFQVVGQYWRKTCVIFRDSLVADDYRRLRVLLATSH